MITLGSADVTVLAQLAGAVPRLAHDPAALGDDAWHAALGSLYARGLVAFDDEQGLRIAEPWRVPLGLVLLPPRVVTVGSTGAERAFAQFLVAGDLVLRHTRGPEGTHHFAAAEPSDLLAAAAPLLDAATEPAPGDAGPTDAAAFHAGGATLWSVTDRRWAEEDDTVEASALSVITVPGRGSWLVVDEDRGEEPRLEPASAQALQAAVAALTGAAAPVA